MFLKLLFVNLCLCHILSYGMCNSFEMIESLLNETKAAFSVFKKDFEVTYSDIEEEGKRFIIFAENFFFVTTHNEKYKNNLVTFKMSINKFSDKTTEELSLFRGYNIRRIAKVRTASFNVIAPFDKSLPHAMDWREKGAVTPVKDQGQCGSCWAFSTTGSLEGQHFRKTNTLVNLSEQQLVDCSAMYGNNGCHGGLMDNAFAYIKDNNGSDTEESYPYISGATMKREKICHYRNSSVGATVSGFVDIESGNEEDLQEAVATVGPVSVAIDASRPGFRSYKEGVYSDIMCKNGPRDLDHGVLVVGYGVDESSGLPYWLVKNSWGERWGEAGYIKIRRNYHNMCGVATEASYPLV